MRYKGSTLLLAVFCFENLWGDIRIDADFLESGRYVDFGGCVRGGKVDMNYCLF